MFHLAKLSINRLTETLIQTNRKRRCHYNFYCFFVRILSLETELQKKEKEISKREKELAKKDKEISETVKQNEEK